jgi:hypothetical protein
MNKMNAEARPLIYVGNSSAIQMKSNGNIMLVSEEMRTVDIRDSSHFLKSLCGMINPIKNRAIADPTITI